MKLPILEVSLSVFLAEIERHFNVMLYFYELDKASGGSKNSNGDQDVSRSYQRVEEPKLEADSW